jgi:hypothetical protein
MKEVALSQILVRMAEKEMLVLRQELHNLKECQFKFLSGAPAITGLLLGLRYSLSTSQDPNDFNSTKYLLPLVVLLPAWWLFFDKAKTITRIVGYYRLLEAIVRSDFIPKQFPGWERSLEIFRRTNVSKTLKEHGSAHGGWGVLRWSKRLLGVVFLVPTQRYWLLAYYTFAILSFFCLWLPTHLLPFQPWFSYPNLWSAQQRLLGLAIVAVLYCAVANLLILGRLMWGRHSYDANSIVWAQILMAVESTDGDKEDPLKKYLGKEKPFGASK